MWIAFKFLSLCRQTQPILDKILEQESCELLSNFYLCVVRHNNSTIIDHIRQVVNCFQIFIFVSSDTTKYVFYSNQNSCELLSNFYLCVVRHNNKMKLPFLVSVVNCFQIFIFVSSDTTKEQPKSDLTLLWIAFKFLSLCRQTQPSAITDLSRRCCELLSNFYLCVVRHNHYPVNIDLQTVVNCFQIFIFVSSDTT